MMDASEEFAFEFLKQFYSEDIKYEPFGNSKAPDFLVSKSIAVEITLIGAIKNFEKSWNYLRNFNKIYYPQHRELDEDFSYYVFLNYQRNFPSKKEMLSISRDVAVKVSTNLLKGDMSIRYPNGISVELHQTKKFSEHRFLKQWPSDEYEGGFVYSDLKEEVEKAIQTKSKKMANIDPINKKMITDYVLLLLDNVNYGFNEEYIPDLIREVDKKCFSKIFLVHPSEYSIYQSF